MRVVATIKPFYNIALAAMQNTPNKPILLLKTNLCPHDYALKFSDMEVIKNSDLIIWGGEDLECFLTKLLKNNKNLTEKLITTLSLPKIKQLSLRDSRQLDPHIWLSPANAKVILIAIINKLIILDPENTKIYLSNKQNFLNQLSKIDLYIKNKLTNFRHTNYLVFHDAYQYFEKFYDLSEPTVISHNPEMPLNIKQIQKINNIISKTNNMVCLFKEPDFNPRILKNLSHQHQNLKIINLDPIGSAGDYFALLTNLVDGIDECR